MSKAAAHKLSKPQLRVVQAVCGNDYVRTRYGPSLRVLLRAGVLENGGRTRSGYRITEAGIAAMDAVGHGSTARHAHAEQNAP